MISPVTSIAPDLRPASTASTGAQQEYRSAQAFERILLGQLTKAMQATVPTEDDSDSAATKTYTDMLPDQMADALSANGGIGLASDLLRSLRTNGS